MIFLARRIGTYARGAMTNFDANAFKENFQEHRKTFSK